MPSFGNSSPLNIGGAKLPTGGMPRVNGNAQTPGAVSMFGNKIAAPSVGGRPAARRRPGSNQNNLNFFGKLENLKNNISNTKTNKL